MNIPFWKKGKATGGHVSYDTFISKFSRIDSMLAMIEKTRSQYAQRFEDQGGLHKNEIDQAVVWESLRTLVHEIEALKKEVKA